jgi:hypothetical protein
MLSFVCNSDLLVSVAAAGAVNHKQHGVILGLGSVRQFLTAERYMPSQSNTKNVKERACTLISFVTTALILAQLIALIMFYFLIV